jgi:hypothetical protein
MQIRFELKNKPGLLGDVAQWWCETLLGTATDLIMGELPGMSSDVLGFTGAPDTMIDVICGDGAVSDPDDVPA